MSELTLPTLENSLQTMSPPNPATPPKNGACIWWTLPKEVSDKILEFSYGTPDKPISILDRPAFECLQMDKEFDWDDEEKSFEVRPSTILPFTLNLAPWSIPRLHIVPPTNTG
jgi:hypothetical protein